MARVKQRSSLTDLDRQWVGTTLENTMPAIKDVSPSQAAVRNLRVLLVDDDQEDSYLFETKIGKLNGYIVDLVWTNDYEDALRLMRHDEFDAHFVDFRLAR